MKRYKTGLTIMRAQPFHIGHEAIICQMLDECETVIVLLGSAQESGTFKNPFNVSERTEMIKNVFGETVLITGIEDLGNINLWAGYVLSTIWKKWRLEPDAYYCGTEFDGPKFADAGLDLVNISREIVPISATQIREDIGKNIDFINPKNREMVSNFFTKK